MNACTDTSGLETQLAFRQPRTLTDGHVIEHLADAFCRPTIDLSVLHVIEEVVLVSMATEAHGGRPYRSAVLAFSVPPGDI